MLWGHNEQPKGHERLRRPISLSELPLCTHWMCTRSQLGLGQPAQAGDEPDNTTIGNRGCCPLICLSLNHEHLGTGIYVPALPGLVTSATSMSCVQQHSLGWKPAVCTHRPESQSHPVVHQKECGQQVEGGDPLLCSQHPTWWSSAQTRHLSFEDKLRELRLFNLKKKRPQGGL